LKIGIIGYGNVGGTLGRRWAEIGHDVTFGVRDKTSPKVTELLNSITTTASATDVDSALQLSDIIVLATPWDAVQDILKNKDSINSKIVIDCTNPLSGIDGLTIGTTSSAGEKVSMWAHGAKVVKAFNSTGSKNMDNPKYGEDRAVMFVCGEDNDAKNLTKSLVEELGFDAIDAGGIIASRWLEPLAMLWINLAYKQGMGQNIAFKLMKR
jgi:predicted dinucleotide-binding enzyme